MLVKCLILIKCVDFVVSEHWNCHINDLSVLQGSVLNTIQVKRETGNVNITFFANPSSIYYTPNFITIVHVVEDTTKTFFLTFFL